MDDPQPIIIESVNNLQFEVNPLRYDYPASEIKSIVNQSKAIHLDNSQTAPTIEDSAKKLYLVLITFLRELNKYVFDKFNPRFIYERVQKLLENKLIHRDLIIGGVGLLIGGLIGYWLAVALSEKSQAYLSMQAVQCFRYSGVEGVAIADDAVIPKDCGKDEVLVSVKAGSVNPIDVSICSGYGSLLRSILSKYFKYWRGHLPVTLGRSCTGVVVEIGEKVTRLEIGDEVWLTKPFWSSGVLSQYVLSSEYDTSKKPTKIGFESASSLPYTGGLALCALKDVNLTSENTHMKRVLVLGGCSAVGCVLVQILKTWNAKLTATCYEKATPVATALGIKDIISLPVPLDGPMYPNKEDLAKQLRKELDIREPFDAIISTIKCEIGLRELHNYCQKNGVVISTLPQAMGSDSFGFFRSAMFSLYVRSKCFIQRTFLGRISNFGEAHISYLELDQLAQLVDAGNIQTVVDRVFQPYDIEQALLHMQSIHSIGSSVVTFR